MRAHQGTQSTSKSGASARIYSDGTEVVTGPDGVTINYNGDGRKPPKIPMAGVKLAQFMTSPLGEEVLEGVLGGTMVVAPQFFSEEDPRENALQLALAIGGGIGVGMAGRRIGADLGKRIHEGEIKNEAIATMARFGGEERMSQGLANGMTQLSAMNSFGKLKDANLRLRMDLGTLDDAAFSKSYPELASKGVLPSTISKEQLDILGSLTEESSRVARRMVENSAEEQAITGEHVGRMLGRVLGDEIGILGGAGAGALLATQLGWQSPKDAQIAALQEQLAQR